MAIGDPRHGEGIARLSLSVYLELMTVLGAYREALVLVGGWAPHFILEQFGRKDTDFRHVGSIIRFEQHLNNHITRTHLAVAL
jgi:hypothetical protein